jgi:hypothetical protein
MLEQPPPRRVRHLRLTAGWLSALLGNLAFHLGGYAAAGAHSARPAGRVRRPATAP